MHHKKLTQGFLDGGDISFAALAIDSLASMELCIALEEKTGVSIMPDELEDIGSLNALAEFLLKEGA